MTPTDNKPESMVERVAKAAYDCLCPTHDIYGEVSSWPDTGLSVDADTFRDCARAAIEAMREPTEAMLDDVCLLRDTWDSKSVTEQWKYLIDEALK